MRHFSAQVLGMIVYKPGDPRWSFSVQLGVAPEWMERFQDDFTLNDNLCEQAFRSAKVGTVAADWMLVSIPELRSTRFAREWTEPQGLLSATLIKTAQSSETIGLLSIIRDRHAGEWERRDVQELSAISPHIVRATAVSERLGALQGQLRTTAALLDRFLQPLIVTDDRARVYFASPSAEAILQRGDGLQTKRGALEAANRAQTAQLQAAIAAATRRVRPHSAVVAIVRPSDGKPVQLLVSPIAPELELLAVRERTALIFIAEPKPDNLDLEAALRARFRLTAAEAQLVRVMLEGTRSLGDAAQRLQISRNTAKTHLQHVFAKTDTHRQSELLRVALRALPGRR
jgi:DNA-binding CsgD family transcriptional regulator/PAS domain-containing protein